MYSTKAEEQKSSHANSAADHDANCPCLSIALSLAAAQEEMTRVPPPKPRQAPGSPHANSIFDSEQLNYLQKIEQDPHAVYTPPRAKVVARDVVQELEGSKIAALSDDLFGNFKDVAQQAISARKGDKQKRKISAKRTSRKRVPDFLVSQIKITQVQRSRMQPQEQMEDIVEAAARQFASDDYEQFHYPSYKRFQSGNYDGGVFNEQGRDGQNDGYQTDEDSHYNPGARTRCSFLEKTAQQVSHVTGCEHNDLLKVVGIAAAIFAVVTWSLIFISSSVKTPAKEPNAVEQRHIALAPMPPRPFISMSPPPSLPAYGYRMPSESGLYIPSAQEQEQPNTTQTASREYNSIAPSLAETRQAHASATLASHLFGWSAFGLLCMGVTFLVFMWRMFSPSGLVNILEKRKYVPSQFRGEHKRLLGSLGTPLLAGGLPLGQRGEWAPWCPWETKLISLPPSMRAAEPHTLIVGQRRTGKSRLVASMVKHDILSGDRAVVVIDTSGDLVDTLIDFIEQEEHRTNIRLDVITINPEHLDESAFFNPMLVPNDNDWLSVATAVVNGFKAIYAEPPGAKAAWSAQTANIMRNATLLLLANQKSLADLPRVLNDNDFRDSLLDTIEKRRDERAEYSSLLSTWGQYKKLARTDEWINWVEPILNRITPLLSDSRLRNILNASENNIDLLNVIKKKSIVLVRLPRGTFGQTANLVGSLFVTALRRDALSFYESNKRKNDVSLFVDEFDSIVDKDTIELLSLEKDKVRIGLTAVCKSLQNFPDDFKDKLLVSFGNIACFALTKKDADLFGPLIFRIDGLKIKHRTVSQYFNKANSAPQFELVSDEEKLNMDRLIGQCTHQFYFYIATTKSGVFSLKTHDWESKTGSGDDRDLILQGALALLAKGLEVLKRKLAAMVLA